MDTVTQVALGAAVGEAVAGRQVGRRAMLWGGLCGLFPDLDVLVPLGDAVKDFTYHRGASHSLFVLAALTPLFVWLIRKLHPQFARFRTRWVLLVFLAFYTHVLLDCLTVYGTQIFWPLRVPPVMGSTVFIIDPTYSVPLFLGVLAALMLSREKALGHAVNTVCLMLTTAYLLWSVGAKMHVEQTAHAALARQNIAADRVLTVPTPFNTLLWRVLAMDAGGYYEGYYSLLDADRNIRFTRYASNEALLQGIEEHWPVQRLQWFTHGFYAVEQMGNDIVITDLRMGLEPYYVFRFKVGETGNPHGRPTDSRRVRAERRLDQLQWVWARIWQEDPVVNRPLNAGA